MSQLRGFPGSGCSPPRHLDETRHVLALSLSKRFIYVQSSDALLSAIFCGLTLHMLFNKLEHTHLSPVIRLACVLPLLPAYFLYPHCGFSNFSALSVGYLTSCATLLISILLYRLSPFHTLAAYPGPILARCSKFWGLYHAHTGKTHILISELHRRYGPIVRIGPNELSICDVDVIQPVLGAEGLPKGPVWDGRKAPNSCYRSSISERDVLVHLERRKPWNMALGVSSIKDYEPILRNRLYQLLDILQDKAISSSPTVDLAKWISMFSYDFMGDMAFGGLGYELMRDGDVNGLWKIMDKGIRIQSYNQHVPWANPIQFFVPGIGPAAAKLRKFTLDTSLRRIERGMGPMGVDLSSYLLDEVSASPTPMPLPVYSGEALLAIVAGSDTSATVLSSIFFYLLFEKKHFERLRREIDQNFPTTEGKVPADDTTRLANMPFLNAVINEALRLIPPVPTGLQRAPKSNSGGKMIGTIFVSPGTSVSISPYAIHRDPRYFSPHPNQFIPDRWLASSEDATFRTNHAAFIPYSIGPMNCAGKLLAQLELRVVVATLVQQLDMELDPEWDPARWESELEDCFVFAKGTLPVLVRKRREWS